ncbi:MAG TPA: GreA/GreB family elongation factor [Acidimicrobiales bacterium]|nr:GreA/GreB family elongation factor [Acidimicrobiales bacterium]
MTNDQSSGQAQLTEDGRRLLEERIRNLESTIDNLQDAVEDPERTEEMVLDYQRTAQEIGRLRSLLQSATTVEDGPDDPHVVELGDTVTIRLDDGAEEAYIVVHAAEAAFEDQRISAESPLGRALLSRRIGERVEVKVPSGSYECVILSASRR